MKFFTNASLTAFLVFFLVLVYAPQTKAETNWYGATVCHKNVAGECPSGQGCSISGNSSAGVCTANSKVSGDTTWYGATACHKGIAGECPAGQGCSLSAGSNSGVCVSNAKTSSDTTWYGSAICHKGIAGECPSSQSCSVNGNADTGVCTSGGSATDVNAGTGAQDVNAGTGAKDVNAGSDTSGGTTLQNPLNVSSLPEFLTAILKGVVEIGAIFLTFMLVYVGFLFVAAQGNPEKLSSARSALVWTIIGGVILLGAEAISLVIQATVQTL